MSRDQPSQHALEAFTMILLRCGDRYLMLQRSAEKRFAPGRWTGIGGRIEPEEQTDLAAAALRELREETGIKLTGVRHFLLRRALLQVRPDHPVTTLLYFTGDLSDPITPDCPEGTLHWLTESEITSADVIENTALVIPRLIDDLKHDPSGLREVITGACAFDEHGGVLNICWSS